MMKMSLEELEKEIEIQLERIRKGELKITLVEDRIITPDQKKPHQWGYF